MTSLKGYASGRVQGVGFRYFVMRKAEAATVCGYVCNLPDGRVEFLLQGDDESVAAVIEQIRSGPRYAEVSDVSFRDLSDIESYSDFRIR